MIYDSEMIKDAPGEPTVGYSVFPLPDFYRLIDSGRFQLRKYVIEAVLHTEVVFEREGEARRFLKAVLDLR